MAWKLHAIAQTQLRRQYHEDGAGHPKFDFHAGRREVAVAQQRLQEDQQVAVVAVRRRGGDRRTAVVGEAHVARDARRAVLQHDDGYARPRPAVFGRVESRPRARVPIVVLQDRATRVSCDVSFADDGGPPVAVAPAHRDHGDLLVFLKALLRDRDLAAPRVEIEFRTNLTHWLISAQAAPFTGGLGSFRTSLLLATYLGRPDPEVGLLRGFLARTAGRRGGGLTANLSIRGVGYGGVDVGRVRRAFSDALGAASLAGMLSDCDGLVALRADSTRRAAEACRSAPRGAAIPPPTCYAPLEPAEPDLFGRD